jgi:hypothetical protein
MDRFAAIRAWVRSENVARFRHALSSALPTDQRRIIEELLAAELRNSASTAAKSQQAVINGKQTRTARPLE